MVVVAVARGVVGDDGVLNDGRGGGGMAFRSWFSFVLALLFKLLRSSSGLLAVFGSSWLGMGGFFVASIEGWRFNHSSQGR